MEREENAEECWISLRLGRSVALLLHYFAIPPATSYFSSASLCFSQSIRSRYEYFDVASSRNLFRKVGELIVNRDEDLEVN